MENLHLNTQGDPIRIVLIDDDKVTIFMSKKILSNYDPKLIVDSFASGKEAIDFLKINKPVSPTILLLDINMPDYSGWDFLQEFSDLTSDCKVFMFTSSIDMKDLEKSKTFKKVLGFISKPLNAEKIKQLLADAFN